MTTTTTNDASPRLPDDLQAGAIYLLAIRGTVIPKTTEEVRKVHNQTAGAPEGVAAARALGDLSHMVYVPLGTATGAATELLILDLWTSVVGLGQFFANPDVQKGGGRMFATRDPVVFRPAPGFTSYDIPCPTGKNQRFVGTIRGTLRSLDQARETMNAGMGRALVSARRRGLLSHHMYLRLPSPGERASLEIFGVDVWDSSEGMLAHYGDKEHMAYLGEVFAGAPVAAVWEHPAGDWVEW